VSSEKKPELFRVFRGLYGLKLPTYMGDYFVNPIIRIPYFSQPVHGFMVHVQPKGCWLPLLKATCALALLELRRGQARFLGWRFGKD